MKDTEPIRLRVENGITHSAGWEKNKQGYDMVTSTCGWAFAGDTWLRYRVEREELVTCIRCVVQGLKG